MAGVRGSARVFLLLAFILKITLAVQDPLNDPSLEIIRQQDAEEGLTQGYQDPNAIPCRDPTPINGALEVVSGIPFLINSIVVKLKCLNGLVFRDGTTEKTERCFGAPTPLRMTGIWSPDQEIFVCQEPKNKTNNVSGDSHGSNATGKRFLESLLCPNPKTSNNKIKVINGDPNHLYSTIEVSCPTGYHFKDGQEVVNATCLPLPDPCYCKASWETLDQYKLLGDFNCIATTALPVKDHTQIVPMHTPDSKPVPCYDPTPTNGAMEVLSGTPFVISDVTVKIMCLHGLTFPDGTTEKNATCLPASTPYHVTGVWTPPFGPLTCQEKHPKANVHTRFLESLVCDDPKTPSNTVTALDGDPPHMGGKLNVTCNNGGHFGNGLTSVNVTCTPLPHPCMCMAAWQTVPGYQLMYSFNCTVPDRSPVLEPPISVNQEEGTSNVGEINANPYQDNVPTKEEESDVVTTFKDNTDSENEESVEHLHNQNEISNSLSAVNSVDNIDAIDHNYPEETNENSINEIKQQTIEKSNINSEPSLDEEPTNVNQVNEDSEEDLQEESITDESKENIDTDVPNEEIEEENSQNLDDTVNPIPQSIVADITNQHTDETDNEEKVTEVESVADSSPNDELTEDIAEEDEEEEARLTEATTADENNSDIIENDQYEEDGEAIEAEKEKIPGQQDIDENGDEEEEKELNEEKEERMEGEEEEGVYNGDEEEEVEEPEEEEWESDTRYEIDSDKERTVPVVVLLDESLPLKGQGTSIIYNTFKESYKTSEEEEEDHFNEENEGDRHTEVGERKEHDEEEEEEETIEEYDKSEDIEDQSHEQEEDLEDTHPIESPDIESNEETLTQEVDAPAPLFEIQTEPFQQMEDDVDITEGEVDPCLLKPNSGTGKRVHKRYFYDSSIGECTAFIYGGSGGNENNFEDLQECLDVCYNRRS